MTKKIILSILILSLSCSAIASPKDDIISHWKSLGSVAQKKDYIYSVFLNYLNTGHLESKV